MIHWRNTVLKSLERALAARVRTHGHRIVVALMIAVFSAACGDDNGTGPNTFRFGQIGEIQVTLETPIGFPVGGTLSQTLRWESSGAWSVFEEITYRGLVGDETLVRSVGDPFAYVASYAQLITTVNSVDGLKLFIPDPLFQPGITVDECGPTRTRMTFSIVDVPRDSTATWIQCARGSLSEIRTLDAGPRPEAARLVMATQAARDATFGRERLSAYHLSEPFGTLARGEDTETAPSAPFVISDEAAWSEFWLDHAGSSTAPEVDFETEMVIVAAVGERGEAGDSVEVRRILQVDDGTLAHLSERVPGDFCSPVARSHYPFHIVVAPQTPEPIRFAEVGVERVSCGG